MSATCYKGCPLEALRAALLLCCRGARALKQPSRAQTMAVTLAGKVAELNLGQYPPDLLKLAVRQAVNPAEAASHLREIQVAASCRPDVPPLVALWVYAPLCTAHKRVPGLSVEGVDGVRALGAACIW